MAEQNNQRTEISAEEILKTELIVNQALIDILIDKQIISEEELIAGIRKLRKEQQHHSKEPGKIVSLKG